MKKIIGLLILSAALLPARLCAQESFAKRIEQSVVEHTLKNGMKLLILPRHNAPLVSFQMMFKCGGVDEVSGKTGLAHLFEHMMFKGTRTIGTRNYKKEKPLLEKIDRLAKEIMQEKSKGEKADAARLKNLSEQMNALEVQHQEWLVPSEFESIYQQAGTEGLNAFTAQDMTGFVVDLPSNKWELWAVLESERMRDPILREFYKERDVVMEERRMRYESSARGKLWEAFIASAFVAHPYRTPTIGWSDDIQNLTLDDAKEFFKQHYSPNNAVLAVVGDVDAQQVIQKLEKYFSDIKPYPVTQTRITKEPLQDSLRRTTVYFDAEPALMMGFHKPNAPHADNAVFEVIEDLLSRGRTSRFYKNIVQKKVAASADAWNANPGERYPNVIIFSASPSNPNKNIDAENAIWQELDKLKTEKVSQQELQKVLNQIEADLIRGLDSNGGMAGQLVYAQTVLGDWRNVFLYLDQLRAVTPEQIQVAAQKYFTKRNATIVFLERE